MSYLHAAERLAALLHAVLSTEDFDLLIDLLSDDATDMFLFRTLKKRRP